MFRWLTEKVESLGGSQSETPLQRIVRQELGNADEATVRIVAAITGLLGTVAYADRHYAPAEEQRIRDELRRVEGLGPSSVEAICAVLREHIAEVSTIEAPVYARELKDLADRELRLLVLDALVDVAAADDEILVAETNLLRLTATALGLSQDDYNASQMRHREKLKVLRSLSPT
jgi:uncharacterized tellurite resistance protein B-like protein